MKISMNADVTMNYEIRDVDNNLLESSKEPVTYLHGGYDQIFPKVEEAMHNKNKGDKVEIVLEPAEAFGEYDPELVQLEPTSAFPESQLKEGMAFEGEDEKGEVIIYYIKTITDGKVEVDGNHPWAGERINFLAIIEDVRTAKDEEISNKHVQQPGEKKH